MLPSDRAKINRLEKRLQFLVNLTNDCKREREIQTGI